MNWSDVKEAAKLCANNHAKFESFGWDSEPKDSENYFIYITSNRDSRLLEKSNEEVINETLLKYNSVTSERHNHWAVGFVDCLVICVYKKDGKTPTKAFTKFCELQASLEDYPVLDETDYSNREHDATIENIKSVGGRYIKENAPDDWPNQVLEWFWEHNQRAVENRDDQGGYPSRDELKQALTALNLREEE